MQALLTNIELDIQELKYLMDAFSREPNAALREVLKRSILQMRARLDQLLLELDAEQKKKWNRFGWKNRFWRSRCRWILKKKFCQKWTLYPR